MFKENILYFLTLSVFQISFLQLLHDKNVIAHTAWTGPALSYIMQGILEIRTYHYSACSLYLLASPIRLTDKKPKNSSTRATPANSSGTRDVLPATAAVDDGAAPAITELTQTEVPTVTPMTSAVTSVAALAISWCGYIRCVHPTGRPPLR